MIVITGLDSKLDNEAVYRQRISGKLKPGEKLRVIDLFSGVGGLTLGFSEKFGHSFIPVWANDIEEESVKTFNRNFGDVCVAGEIGKLLDDKNVHIPKADIVIGGPPCQGFSLLNKNRDGDPRKKLWVHFMEVVKRSEAPVFLMENVPQMIMSEERGQIEKAAKDMGFKVTSTILCAADYGAPQTRWRGFIMGCKFADPAEFFPPKKTHSSNGSKARKLFKETFDKYIESPDSWRTVRDAISDLPEPKGTEVSDAKPPMNMHFGRTPTAESIARYKAIPKEGMNRFDLQRAAPEITPKCWIRKKSGGTDLFGRLWWDRPSVTIRTEFFKPEKGRYLHPVQHRPITHREAARLQTFPDDFVFTGSKIDIARHIGNAVPPVLAARIADSVYCMFKSKKSPKGGAL